MPNCPQKLIANLAAIDRKAIDELGIPGLLLMEEAGRHVSEAVLDLLDCVPENPVVAIVCGPGNNGGDGYVCARHLARNGLTHVCVIHTASEIKGDAKTNFEMLRHYPVEIISLDKDSTRTHEVIHSAHIVVDALLGSGLSKPVEGKMAQCIEVMNGERPYHQWVIAVDLPSGICAQTGQVLGVAVQADTTITFAAPKPGLYLVPGKEFAGEVRCVDIGIPARLIEEDASQVSLITREQVEVWLPVRHQAGHKYTHGNVLVIAGSRTMPGAPVLTSEAAMTSGAGVVTLAAPQSVFSQLAVIPEIIHLPLPESPNGNFSMGSFVALEPALEKYDAVAVGPGMGTSAETLEFLEALLNALKTKKKSLVLDADGLNGLCQLQKTILSDVTILTPHIGEAARLLEWDKNKIENDLIAAAQALREKYQVTVVLKSASTVIATQDGRIFINSTGNSGMATAGSGDVLTGILSGLIAQNSANDIVPCGVYLHGLAGDLAAEALSQYAMKAGDITHFLPAAFQRVAGREGPDLAEMLVKQTEEGMARP